MAALCSSKEVSPKETEEIAWSKSLEMLPMFTAAHIERHRENSGKKILSSKKESQPIEKTLKKGLKFQEERYLSADDIYSRVTDKVFVLKSKCRASMKREFHLQQVSLFLDSGEVASSSCSCKAGKSGYCNHVMALLIEVAEYSLHQLKEIPEERACTEKARRWGIPGEKDFPKEAILSTSIQTHLSSRGINPTMYDPRTAGTNCLNPVKLASLKADLKTINPGIGFAHVIPPFDGLVFTDTRFGKQTIGFPLSYQLSPVDFNFEVVFDIPYLVLSKWTSDTDNFSDLPLSLANGYFDNSSLRDLSAEDKQYLNALEVSLDEAQNIEKQTTKQRDCKEWFGFRKGRLTSTKAH